MKVTDASPPSAIEHGYSPRDLLLRIARGDNVSADEARRCLAGGDFGPEGARLDRARARKARDTALRQAADNLAHDAPCLWTLATRLQAAVRRFEARLWPRLRLGLQCGELSPSDEALHLAFLAAGGKVPRSDRALYELLKT